MEPFRLLWLEEPVPPENVAAMREVKRVSPVPLCSGENLYLRWGFRDLLEQQAVDYIMPDIPKCGGLSECRKIANMAEVYYVPLAPHNVCGPLGTMASAHVCASIPNFLVMEWHWIDYKAGTTSRSRTSRSSRTATSCSPTSPASGSRSTTMWPGVLYAPAPSTLAS